jgi:alpha-D-ribose 1-methylphosphonate 5-triphosphate synthase subunit PhnH
MTLLAEQAPLDFARLQPGFADLVRDAQRCYRALLDAMAHPAAIVTMPRELPSAAPLGPVATAIALTLCDADTPVWLDEAVAGAAGYLAFHCGARRVSAPGEALFAFASSPATLPPLDSFALGTAEFPERATTLVIEVGALTEGSGLLLRGPGIRGERRLDVVGLSRGFWTERAALAELFPRGIDLVFAVGGALAAVPRSTQVLL